MPSITSNPNPYSFSLNPMIFEIETTEMSGVSAPYVPTQDNLYCYVEVWQKGIAPDPDVRLAQKRIPYSKLTKKATVDIHGVIQLSPTLPIIRPDLGDPSAEERGTASDSSMTVYIKYADSYGSPSAPQALTQSGDYHVIYGYSKTKIPNIPYLAFGIDLHAYIDDSGATFAKELSKSQPDWIYVLAMKSASVNFQVDVEMTYIDGTTESFTAGTYPMDANYSVHWLAAGYTQLDIDTHASNDVYSYKVSVREQGNLNAMAIVTYLVDQETPWEKYLIMDNGVGGIESVRMSGKHKYSVDAQRKNLIRNWQTFDYESAQIDNYAVNGQDVFDMSTGYYHKDYIKHLRQLLLGKIWLLDDQLGFVKLICTETSKQVNEDDQVLHALACSFKNAWEDFSLNNFHQKWLV